MKKLFIALLFLGIIQISAQEKSDGETFTIVEQQPEFPGGLEALQLFLFNNINYPEKALENRESGTVFVTFVVDKSGAVRDVEILRGVSPSLDEEALRVIKSLPDWSPGKIRGKAVNVQYNIPVKFSLRKKKK